MSTWCTRPGPIMGSMNGEIAIKPINEAGFIAKAAQAIAMIICLAFMLDCLADERWPRRFPQSSALQGLAR
jgi:hypothetical protein